MKIIGIVMLVLAFVAVIGHGLWLFIAWIVRGCRPARTQPQFEPTLTEDSIATARYLKHLRTQQLLDEPTFSRLMGAIHTDFQSQHSQTPRIQKAAAAPATESPAVAPARPPASASTAPRGSFHTPPTTTRSLEQAAESLSSATLPPPAKRAPPPPPRRSFGEVMAGFMAERNIRWGELIGGLLILGSSTALVISLWSQIESIPMLKFAIFTTVTTALFGAGLFVQHRWKLPTTGRSVLTIATLLVPLNLLAFAAFSGAGSSAALWSRGIEWSSVALFGWLTFLAGRVLMPEGPKLFAGGVIVTSSTALVARFLAPQTAWALWGTAALPVSAFVVVMAATLWRRGRSPQTNDEQAKCLILQLGVQALSCIAPFGLVVHMTGDVAGALQNLAPLVGIMAAPALVVGLMLWRGLAEDGSPGLRTWTAAIALIAALVMLAAGLIGDPARVTWTYLGYAVATFAATRWLRSALPTWCGTVFLQVAAVSGCAYTWTLDAFAWPTAMLMCASVVLAGALLVPHMPWTRPVAKYYRRPWMTCATWIACGAAVWLLAGAATEPLAALSWRMMWVAALWGVVAFADRNALAFAGAQCAIVASGCTLAHHMLADAAWYTPRLTMLLEPRLWQTHLAVVAAGSLLWAVARVLSLRRAPAASAETSASRAPGSLDVFHGLLNPRFVAADQILGLVAVVGTVCLCLWSVVPGLAAEHGVHQAPAAVAQHAAGPGSWILVVVLAAGLMCQLTQRHRHVALAGLTVIVACSTALLAARFDQQRWVGVAWRSLLAGVGFLPAVVVWARTLWTAPVDRLLARVSMSGFDFARARRNWIALFCGPVVLLSASTVLAVGSGLAALPAGLSAAGLRIWILGPLLVVCATLLAFGLGSSRRTYASWAAALTSLAVLGTELALLGRAGMGVSLSDIVWLVQLNAMVSAAVALAWRGLATLHETPRDDDAFPLWPMVLARVTLGVTVLLAGCAVWLSPDSVQASVGAAGSLWGLIAILLVEGFIFTNRGARQAHSNPLSLWGFFGIAMLSCALQPYDTGNWLCFHTLAVGIVVVGGLHLCIDRLRTRQLLGAGWSETFDLLSAAKDGERSVDHDLSCGACAYNLRGLTAADRCPECGTAVAESMEQAVQRLSPEWAGGLARRRNTTALAVSACALLSALFAIRAAFDDPQRPWWSVGIMVLAAALCMNYAAWTPRRGYAYWGGLCACLAACLWFFDARWQASAWPSNLGNLVHVNVLVPLACAQLWRWIERRFVAPRLAHRDRGRMPLFHAGVAELAPIATAAVAGVALLGLALQEPLHGLALSGALAIAGTALHLVVMRREAPASKTSFLLFVVGLAAVALVFSLTRLSPVALSAGLATVLAAYGLVVGATLRVLSRLRRDTAVASAWSLLTVSQAVLCALAVGLGFYATLAHPQFGIRLLVAGAAAVAAGATALMVRGDDRDPLRVHGLTLLGCSAVLLSWAFVDPHATGAWMQRTAGITVSYAVLAAIAGLAIGRFKLWRASIRHTLAGLGVVCGVALLYLMSSELRALLNDQIPALAGIGVLGVIAALSLMIICCVSFAVWPRFDPLSVAPSTRGAYIYAAEILGVVLALHIRCTMPWLFHGLVTQFWPILVLGIAVVGLTLGEFCQRQGVLVLSRPFMRTGMVLPALAAGEILIQASRVHGSLVLLAVGAVYAVLAVRRQSLAIGLLATLALNGSLWYLLYHTPGLGLTQHPQLWFIPLSLAVLAAGQLNREQLSESQRVTIHYVCLLVIYLSSTADIFLIGVARAPWLPLVLAGLSVVGIFVGLAKRVQSYLFLGTGFLCLALLTMMWHAASNLGWTWVWYVAGIALGIAIITVFALFEKKRNEVTALIGEVREWSG